MVGRASRNLTAPTASCHRLISVLMRQNCPSHRIRSSPAAFEEKKNVFLSFRFCICSFVFLFYAYIHIYIHTYIYILHISHRHTAHHVSQLTREELIDILCLCDGMCFSLSLSLFSFFRSLFLTTE